MRNRGLTALGIALALTVGIAFYRLAGHASRGGDGSPLYSVRRHDPYGSAALFDLLSERGIETRTLERVRPGPTDRGTLLQILPVPPENGYWSAPPPEVDAKATLRWVADGNRLVILSRHPTAAAREIGFKVEESAPILKARRALEGLELAGKPPDALGESPRRASLPGSGRGRVLLLAPAAMDASTLAGGSPLISEQGVTVGAEVSWGQGQVVYVSAPTVALNGWILEGGNVEFLLQGIGSGPVLFDEYSHGLGRGGTLIELISQLGLLPLLFQLILVLVLYSWSTHGHPRFEIGNALRRRSSVEQVETLGFLYEQSLSKEETWLRVEEEAKSRLAGALRARGRNLEAEARRRSPAVCEQTISLLSKISELDVRARSEHFPGTTDALRILTESHLAAKAITHDRSTRR